MKLKKSFYSIVLAILFVLNSISIVIPKTAFGASTSSVTPETYGEALKRVSELGMIDNGADNPNDVVTRGQLCKAVVIAAGLDDTASSLTGSTIFSDINAASEISGYVNTAVKKGLMTGMADGKFHPEQAITFAQACTIFVRVLGYTDQDVTGLWPTNYINMASTLNLTDGIKLRKNDGLPVWAAAVMFDRLMDTKIKKNSPADQDKVFADVSGLFTECVIFDDATTSNKLSANQVLTDKGVYYLPDNAKLEVGNTYRLSIDGNNIINVYSKLKTITKLVETSNTDSTVTYNEENASKTMMLPTQTTYYYHGVKQNYDSLKNVLHADATILFANNDDNTGYEYGIIIDPVVGAYKECIILGNSNTGDQLDKNQVLTDQGVFYYYGKDTSLDLGNKYRVSVDNGVITKVYKNLKDVDNFTVNSIKDTTITYKKASTPGTMILPHISNYYYHGKSQSYDNLKNVIKPNSSIIFTWNDDKTGYDYATIIDPTYGKPEIAVNFKPETNMLGSIIFSDKTSIIKDGQVIKTTDISDRDVVYEVTDIWGQNKYMLVLDDKAEGKVTGILPNQSSPTTVQIDNKNYDLSNIIDASKVSALNTDDKVSALLGYDGKVIDVEKIDYKTSNYVQCIILGNSKTSDNLSDKQVLTDQGTFYVLDGVNLDLGDKYRLVVDGDTIVKVDKDYKTLQKVSITGIVGTTVSYKDGDETKSMILPRISTYYYHGVKTDYNTIKNAIQPYSSLILANNDSNTGYEYGVLVDSVYSKPEVCNDYKELQTDFSGFPPIIRNQEFLYNGSDINYKDVVYEVSNVWGTEKYILVVNNKVNGKINKMPNRLSQNSIQIDNVNYLISEYINLDTVYNYSTGDKVTLVLDKDGKVLDMY